MLYFFYKIIIFSVNKDDIRSANCKFSQNSETVKAYSSRHFRASKRYENVLVDQSKRTYYTNYFIISDN